MDDYASSEHRAVDILADYVRESRETRESVTVLPDPEALARELEIDRWMREGGMDEGAFAAWLPG